MIDKTEMRFRIRQLDWSFDYGLFAYATSGDGANFIAQPLVLTRHEEGAVVHPTMMIGPDSAQSLMNELWSIGVRPRDMAGASYIASVSDHLRDMQKIAMGFLKKEGVIE